MTKTMSGFAGVLLFAMGLPAAAAGYFDGSHPLRCTLAQTFECDAQSGCASVTPQEISAPGAFAVDFKAKTIKNTASGRSSSIENMDDVDGKLIMQGIEDGSVEVSDDGVGWSMSVDDDDGGMVVSVVLDGAAIVGLGWCVPSD